MRNYRYRHWKPGENIVHSNLVSTDAIKIKGYMGTWYTIDAFMYKRIKFYILEHEQWGDEVACLVVDKSGNVYLDDIFDQSVEEIKSYLDDCIPYEDKTIDEKTPNSVTSSRHCRKLDCSEVADHLKGDDAAFVEDVSSTITDEAGNEIQVDGMLVVQDIETKEISLFVPTEDGDTVPEHTEVIGKVCPADDAAVLDSNRRLNKTNSDRRPGCGYTGPIAEYTIKSAENEAVDEWGYEPGEFQEMLEDGESTTGGKFVGFTDDDDFYMLFDVPGEGVCAYDCVGQGKGYRWYKA